MNVKKNFITSHLSVLMLATIFTMVGVDPANAAITLTLKNTTTPDTSGTHYSLQGGSYNLVDGSFTPVSASFNTPFGVDKEFRMINALVGNVGGGGEKSLLGLRDNGTGTNADTIEWVFSDANILTSVNRSDMTPGATRDPVQPLGAVGLWTNAFFFGGEFGFYEPGNPSVISLDTTAQTISVTQDQITAQWQGTFFPFAESNAANQCNTDGQGCSVTLSGTISNVATNGSGNTTFTTFDFVLFGEHRITSYEDTEGGTQGNAGFVGWVAQWELHGSGVFVPPVGNVPPIANAGIDQVTIEGDTMTLDGSGSTDSDGSIVSYVWTQTAGTPVVLDSATAITPSFTAPAAPATLIFQLVVTDNSGDTGTDTVSITVNANQPPQADAGAVQTVTEGSMVTLDGSASNDPDGTIVAYNWTQTGGTSVTLSDPTIASPTFAAPPAPDSLTFDLAVTDDRSLMASASTTVTVEAAAGANALNVRNDALITDIGVTGAVNVLLNDGGDGTLNVSASDNSTTRGGTVNCTPAGDCTYNAPSAAFSGTDSFGYTASDSSGSDSATVFITVGSVPANGTVLSFHNRGAADQQQRYSLQGGFYTGDIFTPIGAPFDDAFTVNLSGSNTEFRMIQPSSAVGGGGEKSAVGKRDNGTGSDQDIFQWIFDANGALPLPSLLIDTDTTPPVPQDSPVSGNSISTTSIFFDSEFAFQLLGPGLIQLDFANNAITVAWPDGLNSHWAGRFFPLGVPDAINQCHTDGQGCGITLSGPLTNVVTAGGNTTFDFKLFGEYRITPYEDTERNTNTGAGFSGWRPQWELVGSGIFTGTVSVLESPSADNGALNPTPGGPGVDNGFDDGRVSILDLEAAGVSADAGVDPGCIGSCFDFTVTGMTQPEVKVILSLSASLPQGAVYRKFINGEWRNFDTSTGDTIESAFVASGGVCASLAEAAWQAGFVAANNCIRLTIKDGGPNDADGAANGAVQDPGGAGVPVTSGGSIAQAPSDTVGGGCSIGAGHPGFSERADWWILAGFLAWLGILARRRNFSFL